MSDTQKASMVCRDSNRHQKSMEGILEVGSDGHWPPGGRLHNPAIWFHPSTITVVSPEPFPHRLRALWSVGPIERHGVLQTLICAPMVRPKRCSTLSNPALLPS